MAVMRIDLLLPFFAAGARFFQPTSWDGSHGILSTRAETSLRTVTAHAQGSGIRHCVSTCLHDLVDILRRPVPVTFFSGRRRARSINVSGALDAASW